MKNIGCKRLSDVVISAFESIFRRIGVFVGRYPVVCIGLAVGIALGFCYGFTLLKSENRPEKLWVPATTNNQFYLAYVNEFYKDPLLENLIFENDNVLTPESLKYILCIKPNNITESYCHADSITNVDDVCRAIVLNKTRKIMLNNNHPLYKEMLKIDEDIKSINVGRNWESICFRVGLNCYVSSILELWGFNKTLIDGLSQEDILDKINEPTPISLVSFKELNVKSLLGGVDNDTYITGARASLTIYGIKDERKFDESQGKLIDRDANRWELEFIEIGTSNYDGINVYCLAFSSFDIESESVINEDLTLLVFGYTILFVYVSLMLSKFNLIEHRLYLAISGLLTVGLSIMVSIGLSSILGFIYTPVHTVLPFLLLGIGVDDMFVVVQAWDNLSDEEKMKPVPEQCSLALKHAGVSVTVTSVTDFGAFLIGATTILPALRSFCVFCGIGIIFLFFFCIMFFTATLSIDRRRVIGKRNACCCCYRHEEEYKPSKCSQKNMFQSFFCDVYAPALMKTQVKVVVLIVTVCMLAFGIWGFVQLEQFFDFRWFLPGDSYAIDYHEAVEFYYPHSGQPSAIYLNNVDLFTEHSKIDDLYENAKKNKFIDSSSFSYWLVDYRAWILENKQSDSGYNNVTMWPDTKETFLTWVYEFLLHPTGGISYLLDVIIDNSTLEITSSRINFVHVVLKGSQEEVEAMDSIQALTDSVQFENGGSAFAFTFFYIPYESNRIIQEELYRNLGLACVCVFLIIFLMLTDFVTCCLVFLAVFLTLIDLAGFVHHWGLTIDVIVTIQLILSIGIAVDYAAHIGHTFMTLAGTREERAKKSITTIGPAVFNGGFSTFLAFVMLSLSSSYVFKTFFKVFLLVVVFGLFNGLALLPVLLSLFGSAPYPSAVDSPADEPVVLTKSTLNISTGTNSDMKPPSEHSDFVNPAFDSSQQHENNDS